jgi:peptide/nickel transport system ATP-binding protein
MTAVLSVEGLKVVSAASGAALVDGVGIEIMAGEMVGLVGESGSGKTTLGMACMGFARHGTRITGGAVRLGEHESLLWSPAQIATLRREYISYVPQSAGFALNPARRLGAQLRERLPESLAGDPQERLLDALEEVALPRTREFLRRYPHQLSGGQAQRVVIASAFIAEPKVVILDEPTTGLDVATQARILEMVRGICAQHGTAAIFISHDLGAVAELCSRVAVMYAGRIVESGSTTGLVTRAQHPYTRGLLRAVPGLRAEHAIVGIPGQAPPPGRRGGACTFADRCELAQPVCREGEPALLPTTEGRLVRCLFPLDDDPRAGAPAATAAVAREASEQPLQLAVAGLDAWHGSTQILHGIDLRFEPGACTAIVGESGSGKTTLCRAIIGLHGSYGGAVTLHDNALAPRAGQRTAEQRRQLQYVFQNPYEALNPRRTIADLIRQPLEVFGEPVPRGFVEEQLELVSLRAETAAKHPDQLSGGERQRVALARALALRPRILICDEVTSSLDVSVQASVVALIRRLQAQMDLTVIFVTHDIALVRQIAQSVVVLKDGRVVERGPTDGIFAAPSAEYTRALLEHAPDLWRTSDAWRAATDPHQTMHKEQR